MKLPVDEEKRHPPKARSPSSSISPSDTSSPSSRISAKATSPSSASSRSSSRASPKAASPSSASSSASSPRAASTPRPALISPSRAVRFASPRDPKAEQPTPPRTPTLSPITTDDASNDSDEPPLYPPPSQIPPYAPPASYPSPTAQDDSEEDYSCADEEGLLDADGGLDPLESLSPLPHPPHDPSSPHSHLPSDDDDRISLAASDDPILDPLSPSSPSPLSSYAHSPLPPPSPASPEREAPPLSTVREGNEEEERVNASAPSPDSPPSTHHSFADLVNRPAFLSPSSPSPLPSRLSIGSQHSTPLRGSTPRDRPPASVKRSSLPSPRPAASPPSASPHRFRHPVYSSPSDFFAAKSGSLGSLSGSIDAGPSFSSPATPSAPSPLRLPRHRPSQSMSALPSPQPRAHLSYARAAQRSPPINRSLSFSPNPSPRKGSVSPQGDGGNTVVVDCASLQRLHVFVHFERGGRQEEVTGAVEEAVALVWPRGVGMGRLQQLREGRWVYLLMVDEGEVRGWQASLEQLLERRGLCSLHFVVLRPHS